MKKIFPTLSLIALASAATCASAKDGYYSYYDQHGHHQHSGFYLSIGAGIESTTMEGEADGSTFSTAIDGDTGLQGAIKIGGSLNQNVQLYGGYLFGTSTIDDYTYATGLVGVGVNLFPSNSDLFAEGLIGMSGFSLAYNDSEEEDTWSMDPGVGVSLGLGYQLAKYVEITGRFMFYTLSNPDVSGIDYSVKQFGLTVSLCLY